MTVVPVADQKRHRRFPAKVLIVEASSSERRLLAGLLVEAGAEAAGLVCVASIGEARNALLSVSPECILLDLSLPGCTGLEGVSVLTAAAPQVPIVVVAGRSDEPPVFAAMAHGADEYLYRSDLDPIALREVITCERRRGMTALPQRAEVAEGSASVATVDGFGRICAVNERWTRTSAERGAEPVRTGPGVNYLTVCEHAVGPHAAGAAEAAAGIRRVLAGEVQRFEMDYPCPSGGEDRWFCMRVTPIGPKGGGAVVSHFDITDLRQVEEQLRSSSVQALPLLDVEAPILALVDASGVVKHRSEATVRLLDLAEDVPFADQAFHRIHPADQARARSIFERVIARPGAQERVLIRVVDRFGRRRHLDCTATNLCHEPRVGAVAITGCDVTNSRRTQIATHLQSRLLQRLPAAVIVTDDDGTVSYWNERASALYGYSAEEALGREVTDLNIGPTGTDEAQAIMDSVLVNGSWEGDYEARRADGSVLPVHVTLERIVDEEIDFHGIVGASVDIRERRQLEEDLAFQALHDPMTGLPNRHLFIDQLENALARASRTHRQVALLVIDLDDFKRVNDLVGHAVADGLLTAVGEHIRGVLRTGDIVARLGGDEFVVCCEEIVDIAEVDLAITRIRRGFETPFVRGAHSVVINASIGVALSGPDPNAETLLRNADSAMQLAKSAGKGRYELFDDEHHEQLWAHHEKAEEFRAALENGAISAFFQPEVDLATGDLVGFEALARWPHPERGHVPPDEFVGIAEQSGLIGQLGEHMLRESCRALASWSEAAPDRSTKVAVNVSVLQLVDPSFPTTVARILAEHDVRADRLCLEVTESALADDELASAALRRLKEIGVEIAIDDFGTGYSSLSRLHRFPIDYLKIDRSFVDGMVLRREDAVIVFAILELTRALGLRTIAEGIEDVSQFERLRDGGCDIGQGFLWSKAISEAEAMRMVRSAGPLPRA